MQQLRGLLVSPRFLLMLILLLALVLRVWGLDFGLPNLSRPDEQNISGPVVLNILQSFFAGQGSLNPHFFIYPSLYLYVLAALYGLYYLLGQVFGVFSDGGAYIQLYLDDWSSFHLISRGVTVVFGVLTVWAAYGLGKVFGKSERLGLLTAFLLAVTYLHVRESHFGVTDAPAVLWVTLCLWRAVCYSESGAKTDLWLAALFAGLAASTKYPCGLVAIAVLLAFWLPKRAAGARLGWLAQKPALLKEAAQLLLVIGGAFLLASPYVVLDFPKFLADLTNQGRILQTLHPLPLGNGWEYYLRVALWHGLGPVYLLTALAGMFWACLCPAGASPETRMRHWIVLPFAGVFYLLMGKTHYVFVRYALPLVPVMALYAAWCVERLAGLLRARLVPAWPSVVVVLPLLALVAGGSLAKSIAFDRVLAQPDTRALARRWLMAHLQPGDAVGIGSAHAHVDLPRRFRKYFRVNPQVGDIGTNASFRDSFNERGEAFLFTYSDPDVLQRAGIRYFAVGQTLLTLYTTPRAELARIAANPRFRPVAHFSPVKPGQPQPPRSAFDPLDAFYVPYGEPGRVQRPGPEIRIYEVLPPGFGAGAAKSRI